MAEKHEADTSQAVDSAAVDQQQAAGGTSEASSATDAASKNAHVKQVRPASTVPEMIEQLTKKNDEYVFKLRRELKDGGMSATDEETLLKTMLPEMITAQRQGKPATQLYGPVTVKANEILHTPKPEPGWFLEAASYWSLRLPSSAVRLRCSIRR